MSEGLLMNDATVALADVQTTSGPAPHGLPEAIYEVLLRCAKRWMMMRYVGGNVMLRPWDETTVSFVTIASYDLPGVTSRNLIRLKKLASQGLQIDCTRNLNKHVPRSYRASREVTTAIALRAQSEWIAMGYRVGESMPEIKTSGESS